MSSFFKLTAAERQRSRRMQGACLTGCPFVLAAATGVAALVRWIAYPNRLLEFAIATGIFTLAIIIKLIAQWIEEEGDATFIIVFVNMLVMTMPIQLAGGLVIFLLAELITLVAR